MTVSRRFSFFLRRVLGWLMALLALAALGFATAAAAMFFWVLPNIATHRDTVASLMSQALGQRVTLEAVSGSWQQARPEFRLRGVRLYDTQGRPTLFLPELEAAFAWRSLLVFEPRFNHVDLRGLAIDIRRARDGHFYVGGIPINPANPDSGFSSWLLRQGRVHVSGATLAWHDDVRAAPPLVFSAVDFTLTNSRRHHDMRLSATPPAALARPFAATAELTARNVDDKETWNGGVRVALNGVSFPHLAPWLEMPHQPNRGWGSMAVRFGVRQGALTEVGAAVDLRELETVLGSDLPTLPLAEVRGHVLWERDVDLQRLTFDNVRIASLNGTLRSPLNASLTWGARSREVNARDLKLGEWQFLLPHLPMEPSLRTRLASLQPQGRFDVLRFGWTGAEPGIDNFDLATRFTGLAINAAESQPGMSNLSGRVEGDAEAGRFEIDSRQMALKLPSLFREPSFGFDQFQASGTWKKTSAGRRITLDASTFANPDFAGEARGHYEWIPGQRGLIDLNLHLARAEGTAVHRYLPKNMGERTVDWVRRAPLTGRSDDVQLLLKGDLAHFPFVQGKGVFRVEAQVKDAVIDYVPGWPRIEGIDARMLFQGKTMEITANEARIFGVALRPVKAVIPDLIHHAEQLTIEGEANGPLQDFIRFANESPVRNRLHGFTDATGGGGLARLALKLQIPLRHSDQTTLAGRLSFLGNSVVPAGGPRVDQVQGDITFTHETLNAKNIRARFLGGPLQVEASTTGGQVAIAAQGRATAAGLSEWLGPAWSSRLSGQAAWQARIDLEPGAELVRVDSDLVGLGLRLPAPLAKAAAQPLPLWASSRRQGGSTLNEVRLGRTVSALWRVNADRGIDRGEIRFGVPAVMPAEAGLRLAGSAQGLDISGWDDLLPSGGGQTGVTISTVDLDFDTLDLMGRRYQNVRLQGRNRNGLLRTQVTGGGINGVVTYRPAGEQTARVSGQFRQLTVPGLSPPSANATAGPNIKAADFPALDMTVDDFRLQDKALGRLEVVAHGSAQGTVIDNLTLSHPDSVFRMSGLWRDTGMGETRADLALNVRDAGRFLARFGYPNALKRGTADIHGNATWEGSPADFAVETLAGQLDFKARGGQFLKIDPGAGKLLGVLSLQSLPRRLNFDFRDIFNEGYAFDDMEATLRVARGVMYSDDFRMRGPAAKVNMSGLADLNQETVQLRVKVIPKLSEGVAVAGALIGGPLAGVGALAAQKLLRDPFEEVISQEYMVTGAWQTPDVKRMNKAKAAAENQVSEP